MTESPTYLLDSDVFITAKNSYYAFDICPGFWAGLLVMHQRGRVFSISRVRSELLMGRESEDLVQWVKQWLPADFFLEVDAVGDAYAEVMLWVQRHVQYADTAKARFAVGADGWLVAYARVHCAVVVTNEQPAATSRTSIKLPDVCQAFGVEFEHTFGMLRKLGIRFDLSGGR
jgi:hypothetical protein